MAANAFAPLGAAPSDRAAVLPHAISRRETITT
jgi:hypothetical protein